jgi:hypothetical protein
MSWIDSETLEDFKRARRQAFLARLLSRLNHESNDLLPLNEVRLRLHSRGQHYRGLQTVPVAAIVGSEGRYEDFNRQFLPRAAALKDRWVSIDRAHYEDVLLPPVDLYKMGDIYFVKDGNHRISVARQRGQEFIDAFVTEIEVFVPLSANLSLHDLLLKEEYNDFLEWTNLHHLRPDQHIEFTVMGGYIDLIGHINTYRYYMGLEQGREISIDEAVCNWYDTVYIPVVATIRAQHALRGFPNRTEADLYRWIMDHRWYLRERNAGTDPGPECATSDYVEQFGRKGLVQMTERLLMGALSAVKSRVAPARKSENVPDH